MKIVTYRGAVRFAVPENWVEEDEPGVQGIFYENGPDTGTLRVSVFDFVKRDGVAAHMNASMQGGQAEPMGQGAQLMFKNISTSEKGVELLLYRYEIVLPIDDDLARMVVVTYAIRADQKGDPKIVAELEAVDNSARTLKISTDRHLRLDDPRNH